MSKNRHGGRNNRSRGGGGGGAGGGRGRQGKLTYDAGDEPAFIRQFKERTGYKAPATTEDKHRMYANETDERPRDGDYRNDDERPQIVQLNPADLSKEEVDLEIAKAKEAEEEKNCIDSTGRLLFRKPKEKVESTGNEATGSSSANKSEIVEIASGKSVKRKPTANEASQDSNNKSHEIKKPKTQLLSFMDESGFDGDD